MKTAIFSFFSGIGFLDLGFENSDYDVVYVNELYEPFLTGYKYSREILHKPTPEYGYCLGDIRNYANGHAKTLSEKIKSARKNYDLIGFIGGPPCPDFSIGGKNKGHEGKNGVLSQVYIDLICQMKPDFFLFENVKGLWSTQKHRQFYENLKKQLHSEGYSLTDKLTNCIEFGVPQDRWRIFLFGTRSDLLKNTRHTRNLKDFDWERKTLYSSNQAFSFPWPQSSPFILNSEMIKPESIPIDLTTQTWFEKNDTNNHPNTEHCFKPKAALEKFKSIDEGDDSRKSFKRIHRWRYSPTACYGNNEVHLHPYKARRLNASETLAIQSLPKEFELPPDMTLTNMFKAIGNGVPYLAAKGVAETIKEYFVSEILTATDLVQAISNLPKNVSYNYVNPTTRTKIKIEQIVRPEGPINICRYDPSKGQSPDQGTRQSISTEMLWRVANAMSSNQPVNVDRALGASYNTRSALEALLAHTPQFYFCYPGRIEIIRSSSAIKKGHKHLIWRPNSPHELGVMAEFETKDMYISEIPNAEVIYEALVIPPEIASNDHTSFSIDVRRRHAQIQIALIIIGAQLGSRVWVASNDRAIEYKGQKIGEMDNVIASLNDVKLIQPYDEAARAARLIDCIWFRNSRFMPAVFEVEHSTGVTSGLTRMKHFRDQIPPIDTRWVIVAPDEDRHKVYTEANKEQFRDMNAFFFPYSSVEELYSLCQRRKINGVNDEFLDCFMERVIR